MARHTFSNGELAHAFFRQQEFGIDYGNGSSFSFRDNRIYSYSSCIGIADFDRKVFKFRSGSYSSSTCKHQSKVRGAIPHDWKVFRWDSWHNFESNQHWFEERIIEARKDKECLKSGTKFFGKPYLLDSINAEFIEFSNTFNLSDLYLIYSKELEKLAWTEEELEMHKIKTWCTENGITGSYENKVKVFNNPELAAENIAKNKEKKAKLEATKEERKQKAVQKSIDRWYAGEVRDIDWHSGRRYYYGWDNRPVYLRINPNDPKEVETSKHVSIPLVECELLYRKFKQCVEDNSSWKQNGDKFRVGVYHVDRIDFEQLISEESKRYYILAGCHKIYDTQIEEFVNKFTDWNK